MFVFPYVRGEIVHAEREENPIVTSKPQPSQGNCQSPCYETLPGVPHLLLFFLM
jgi:hypothetical protein